MKTSGRLQAKVAVITGAAFGIGAACAELFAREGARLVLADINDEVLKAVQDKINSSGGSAVILKTDVSVEAEVKALVDLAQDTYKNVDVLVNNAGVSGNVSELEDQDIDEWRRLLDINLMGPVYATKYLAMHMKQKRSGSIINVASVAGIRSGAGGIPYSASKAALINFSQTSACEFGGYGVRVNAVCPGLIETEMTRPFFEYARSEGKEYKLGRWTELKRAAKAEEVASVILFLASDEASYITGQAIAVDGGITASLSLPGKKV
jgi:meso-butanediol dehydrogenase/(S,S)-butanediol dehydrogenase/diacetyl reductase